MSSRRDFLKQVGLAGGGLIIATYVPSCRHTQFGAPNDFAPNAFVRVTPDDRIIFTLARVEMGQGTMTSETMLVAEELNIDPAEIEIEHAPNNAAAYGNPEFKAQGTGGSNSTKSSFEPLRKAGAVMREALVGAAAAEWGVPRSEVQLEGKLVKHAPSKREMKIGAIATRAREFINEDAEPKPRSEWKILGKSRQRLDAQAKVDGSAVFGIDPEPKGVEVAVVIHGPFGSTLESFDAKDAEKMPGVKAIFAIESGGIAVVADRYPRARKAANAVIAKWTKSDFSSAKMFEEYAAKLDEGPGDSARDDGNAEKVIKNAKNVIEAEYRFPFLAHAAMEPMNATVHFTPDGGAEVWAPTQATAVCATLTARAGGISPSKVRVHQTLLGGGFGRKTYGDVVVQAAEIAKVRGTPVRLMYSREDDIQRDLFRPGSLHRLRAVVEGGKPIAWAHRLITQSALFTEEFKPMLEDVLPGFLAGTVLWSMKTFGNDPSLVEGAMNVPYAIDNVKVSCHLATNPVLTGVWRSVGHSFNSFIAETFIDELATASKKDPVAFRRELLTKHPRHLGVLELAAKKGDWGKPLPEGHARGFAVHESFASYAAATVELSIEDGRPRVHRVVCAVDCGMVMNPDGVRAQVEGGLIFGLSMALTKQEITFENGLAQQSNFHDFEVLRMHEIPAIEVHIVESDELPTGIGEVAVAPAAPAVANALFCLTGKRIHQLPIKLET